MTRPASLLDAHQQLSAELNTALADTTGWERVDGTTFVAAARPADHTTIVGRDSGWTVVRHVDDGLDIAEPQLTAEAAVKLAAEPAEVST